MQRWKLLNCGLLYLTEHYTISEIHSQPAKQQYLTQETDEWAKNIYRYPVRFFQIQAKIAFRSSGSLLSEVCSMVTSCQVIKMSPHYVEK
ncbi:beta-1 3-galactosyltransferase 5-like X2, partial [Biomphalaria pfeifferi]